MNNVNNSNNGYRVASVSTYIVAHLALILAAFSLAVVLNGAGFGDFVKKANLMSWAVVIGLGVLQVFIYRKMPRMATAFGLAVVGAAFGLLAQMSVASVAVGGFSVFSMLFMAAAAVIFLLEIRKHLLTRA